MKRKNSKSIEHRPLTDFPTQDSLESPFALWEQVILKTRTPIRSMDGSGYVTLHNEIGRFVRREKRIIKGQDGVTRSMIVDIVRVEVSNFNGFVFVENDEIRSLS